MQKYKEIKRTIVVVEIGEVSCKNVSKKVLSFGNKTHNWSNSLD